MRTRNLILLAVIMLFAGGCALHSHGSGGWKHRGIPPGQAKKHGGIPPGQAKKLIKSNAVSHNGSKVTVDTLKLTTENALHGRFHVVQKGKKQHHLVVMGK